MKSKGVLTGVDPSFPNTSRYPLRNKSGIQANPKKGVSPFWALATAKRGQRWTKSKAISIVLYHVDTEINQ